GCDDPPIGVLRQQPIAPGTVEPARLEEQRDDDAGTDIDEEGGPRLVSLQILSEQGIGVVNECNSHEEGVVEYHKQMIAAVNWLEKPVMIYPHDASRREADGIEADGLDEEHPALVEHRREETPSALGDGNAQDQ